MSSVMIDISWDTIDLICSLLSFICNLVRIYRKLMQTSNKIKTLDQVLRKPVRLHQIDRERLHDHLVRSMRDLEGEIGIEMGINTIGKSWSELCSLHYSMI